MADREIKGVIVPILTPLKSDESVDVPSLRRLTNYLVDNGVHGIWVSGTTGEFANLTDRERLISIEAVVNEVAGRDVVVAWGANASGVRAYTDRVADRVQNRARSVTCLGVTKDGHPRHPVRLPYATERVPWPMSWEAA